MDIATLGLNVDSRQAATAVKVLDDLAAAGGRAEKSTDKLTGATGSEAQALSKSRAEAAASASAHDSLAASQNKAAAASNALGGATRVLGQALGALGLAVSVRELVSMADAYTNINSRLGLVTSSTRELASAQKQLFDIAQETRTGYAGLVTTFAQMSRSAKEFGASQNTMIGVTRTLSQAITISGASATSANAALVQLSQGFASGTLRGEELNSVMEQTPRVAQAIAEGMGITVGKLREMGQAGMLTAEAVVSALQNSAASVEKEFGGMAVTVDGATTRAANSMLQLVGVMNEITGASGAMAEGISRFAMGLDSLTGQLRTLKGVTGDDFWFSLFKNEKFIQNNLTEAREDLAKFEAQFKKFPNSLYIRADVVEARAAVAKLEGDLLRLRRISGGSADAQADPDSLENRRRAAMDRDRKAQDKLREDRDNLLRKSSGVSDSYMKEMAEGIRLNQAGVLVGKEWNQFLADQQGALLKKTGATKAANAADREANKEGKEQAKLIAELGGLTGSFAEDWERLNGLYASGKYSVEQLTEAQAVLLGKQPAIKAAHDATEKAVKAEAKAYEEAIAARMRMYDALEGGVDKLTESNNGLAEEIELIGLTVTQQNALIRARTDALILVKEAALAEMQLASARTGTMTREEIALQREIELLRERNNLLINKESREASAKVIERQEKQWVDMWESVDKTAHDVFVSVADSGMSAFERIGKTIKASILDMLYQMTVRKWLLNIFANVTGTGGVAGIAAQAAGGAGGLGGIGNILSIGNSAMGLGTTAAGWVGSGVGMLFGQTAGNAALAASLGMGTGSAAAAASGAAIAGGGTAAGAGLGASIGTAIPYIGVALAVLSMIGKATKGETRTGGQFGVAFDGEVTNNRRGQTYTYQGQQFDRDFSGGARNALVNGQAYRMEGDPVAQESAIRGAVAGTAAGINAMLSALGSKERLSGFSAGFETSSKGRGGVFAGGSFESGKLFGESGKGDNYAGTLYETTSTNSPDFQTALANFTLDLKQATVQALQQATDIPKTISDALKNVDAEGLTDEAADALITAISKQIEGVAGLRMAFEAMGLPQFADMAFDVAAGLAAASGGFDQLQSNINTFYQAFFSEEERAANLRAQMEKEFKAAGIATPEDRAGYRAATLAAIDAAQNATGELGDKAKETAAKLLAFAGVFDQLETAAEESARRAEEAARRAEDEARRAEDEAKREAAKKRKDAYDALQSAIDAENEILEGRIDALNKQRNIQQSLISDLAQIFDLLGNNVRELRGEVTGGAAMQGAQGRAFITAALATARASGYLPDAEQLGEAIGAARGVMADDNYVSRFDADRERAMLAAELDALQAITGKQKTVAELTLESIDKQIDQLEKQIKQNDEILRYWKEQIDRADGNIAATKTVENAVRDLIGLMFPGSKPSGAGGSAPNPATTPAWGGSASGNAPAEQTGSKYKRPFSLGTAGVLYMDVSPEEEARLDKFAPGYAAFNGTGDMAGLNNWIKANKLTPDDMSALSGIYANSWRQWFIENQIPGYRVGTNYVPEDGLAYLHKGEAVVPKEYNPTAGGMAGGGSESMAQYMELLRMIEANTRASAMRTHSINQTLTRVSLQGDALSVRVTA